jgi:hypothetical protein
MSNAEFLQRSTRSPRMCTSCYERKARFRYNGAVRGDRLSTPGQNLTIPPVENLTVRRGDEPQFVSASWRGRRRRFEGGSGSGVCRACQRSVCCRMR